MPKLLVTTANELAGYKVVRQLGLVRGLTVRSRSVFGNFAAGLESMVGGKVTFYITMAERTRAEAYDLMEEHAHQRGANAILAMRYDANEIMAGITEVLAYGTAVVVEPIV